MAMRPLPCALCPAQAKELRAFLETSPQIKYVWYDFACMPQGDRSPEDKEIFSSTLPHVNILYLGATCLLLVDISYLSRFWTQVRAHRPATLPSSLARI